MSHFYERNSAGEIIPRHFVPNASRPGELRASTIRDAKKNGWYGSVTTIQNLLDKPALNDWRVSEHLKVAYEWVELWGKPTAVSNYDCDRWMQEIKECTQDALDKAPQAGTDFHDSMERFILGSLPDDHEHFKVCAATAEEMRKYTLVDAHVWVPEKSFVHELGFAGKVDAHYELRSNEQFVVDFKTKDRADKFKPGKMAYKEMCQQLAAYRVGLGMHAARCLNVFVCIPTGQVDIHEWEPDELDREFANFADLLRIWLRNAEYVPGFMKTETNL